MEVAEEHRFEVPGVSKLSKPLCWLRPATFKWVGAPYPAHRTISQQRQSSRVRFASTPRRQISRTHFMKAEDKKDPPSDDEKPKDGVDWDSSWNEYSSSRSGGVFQLNPEPDEDREKEDERIEKLTSAWSSEIGFLLAIGVIVLIGAFYAYVYATGGISR